MKALTISVADDLYQRASQMAAATETSLSQVLENILCEWAGEVSVSTGNAAERGRRADVLKFLDLCRCPRAAEAGVEFRARLANQD